jgi:hypothetical protein
MQQYIQLLAQLPSSCRNTKEASKQAHNNRAHNSDVPTGTRMCLQCFISLCTLSL